MTTTHEFNQNIIFTNKETHKALVSHFNQIEEIAKNKKFEWEDEELTETYGITFDFDEWFSYTKKSTLEEHIYFRYEVPENLDDDLMNYANQLKDYVNGFLLGPAGMYQGKSFGVETYKTKTFDEIVEHMKQFRQNNQMVFLLQVSQKPQRPKEIVIDNVTYPQDLSSHYKVRYGVLNELEST
jgi:uncharacterized protein YgfB (UPF0149 family)